MSLLWNTWHYKEEVERKELLRQNMCKVTYQQVRTRTAEGVELRVMLFHGSSRASEGICVPEQQVWV